MVLERGWTERYEALEDRLTPVQALILLSPIQENQELLMELLEAFVQEAMNVGSTPQSLPLVQDGEQAGDEEE